MSEVALSRIISNLCNGLQLSHFGLPVEMLEQAKAPVRGEFGMSNYEERECDLGVMISHCMPGKVPEHGVVLILASSIVGVQENLLLTKAMVVEEEVQLTDHIVGPLTTVTRLGMAVLHS